MDNSWAPWLLPFEPLPEPVDPEPEPVEPEPVEPEPVEPEPGPDELEPAVVVPVPDEPEVVVFVGFLAPAARAAIASRKWSKAVTTAVFSSSTEPARADSLGAW